MVNCVGGAILSLVCYSSGGFQPAFCTCKFGAPHTASTVAQMVKNLPAMQETQVQSLHWEGPLKKQMIIHSNILVWRTPWTEEPGGLRCRRSQRVKHDWATNTFTFIMCTSLKCPKSFSSLLGDSTGNSFLKLLVNFHVSFHTISYADFYIGSSFLQPVLKVTINSSLPFFLRNDWQLLWDLLYHLNSWLFKYFIQLISYTSLCCPKPFNLIVCCRVSSFTLNIEISILFDHCLRKIWFLYVLISYS